MWRVLAMAVTLTGCGRLFGLEPPELDDGRDDSGIRADGHFDAFGGSGDGSLDATPAPGCPASYVVVFGLSTTRYRVVTNIATSWDNAQVACLNDQVFGANRYTHLIVIDGQAEMAALTSGVTQEVWVGLSDRVVEGTYQWVTAETTTYPPTSGTPWGAGEPKASGAEDCVYKQNAGELKMNSCGVGKNFVCECDTFMNDPTRY